MKRTISLFSLLGSLFAANTAQAAYQLLDLSAYLDASLNDSTSSSLNDNDGVAGTKSGYNPVYWTGSFAQDLLTLGGSFGSANGVNNAGQVVGWSRLSNENNWHATLWNNSTTATDLGTLGGNNSEAFAINNGGNIVGWSHNNAGQDHATLWSGDNIIDLDGNTSTSSSEAYGINASNQIVGRSTNGSWANSTATLWSYDGSSVTVSNLGAGEAYAINDNGTIVGVSGDNAVFWSGGSMTTLASLFGESTASDINNAGLIVGESRDSEGNYHGVLWSGDAIFDLTSLLDQPLIDAGWLITDAFSINESGNILAYAEDSAGNSRTVLLFNASAAAVPEASATWMLALGLCIIAAQRSRRKTFA